MIRSGAFLIAALSGAGIAAPVVDVQATSPVTAVTSEMLDRLPSGRRIEDLVRTCPSQTIPTVNRNSVVLIDGSNAQPAVECIRPDDIQMIEVLKTHNDLRIQYGSRPLAWDPVLASEARSYGPTLAQYDQPVHSPRTGREWSRENLVQALRGTPTNSMLGVWVGERRYFTPGIFPNVSSTGNWADVGHLTQMLWADTTTVGCAVQRGIGNFDWLICRYAPPGNKDGKMVLAVEEKEPPRPIDRILFCSPASLAAYDVRIPWDPDKSKQPPQANPKPAGSTGEAYSDSYKQISDHLPVKAEYDGTPKPPPESILDDIGQSSPPPESILDDVGDSKTATRESPPPPPKSGKGKAVHDTPMAQPRGPAEPPPESILDDIDQGSANPEPARSNAGKPRTAPPGLSAADEQKACWLLGEVGDVEIGVAALEGEGWGDDGYRADAARRLREELLKDSRFPPDAVRRWVERVEKVLEKIAKEPTATP